MNGSLRVTGLGKAYRKWSSEWQRALSWFGVPLQPAEEHWVLRDVSFNIGAGETVGIVGQNGAGKSTLLKLITGTTMPTAGSVERIGRVAAILELGMGFNIDLTGRENVRHAAGLMGYSQGQIDAAMDEIEGFAEIGEYFDQPVRTYSSGMQMRVAFSVATAFRPDILIVDEALSVGDTYFIHKCFRRIREYKAAGTTLLIVSHDPSAVIALCDRAILIEKGRLLMDGDAAGVMDYYNALIAQKEDDVAIQQLVNEKGELSTVSGTGQATVENVLLLDEYGDSIEFVSVGQRVRLCIDVRCVHSIARLVVGYLIKDRLGQAVFGTNTDHTRQAIEQTAAGERIRFVAEFDADIGAGSYSISVALSSTETHLVDNYEWRDLALVFNVANIGKPRFDGVAWLPAVISMQRANVDPAAAVKG
ncbi:ABC transporter ATP-binding protein [Pseudoxanthomonas winnipegensis]|uniref:ABC transporter ATP-binding protein n=1 Tax=Pseudoxanthomonas winnipegensis TaxID=2480810 RepID=UPI0030F3D909